jgi:D-3-phosphoglycerate dehydrogenase / 2-oxoglutarate reductase
MADAGHLIYFERWIDQRAYDMLEDERDVEIQRVGRDDPGDVLEAAFLSANWYQLSSTRSDIPEPFRVHDALIRRAPNLLVVSTHGAGFDTIDLEACTRAGVLAVNQTGGNREAVAEHAIGMMLMLSKRAVEADLHMRRERGWVRGDFTGHDLTGKALGIIGLGNVGRRLAEIARLAFSMRVLAVDPYVDDDTFREHGLERATLEDVLAQSDFVSVHCPRIPETEMMLGADQFALMKPTAYLVNTARGGILDEYALADALRAGQLAGAGIDVWDPEPPALDHPLLAMDNVIATPHTAGVTVEAREQMAVFAVEQWRTIWRGERPPRILNPEAWPAYLERRAAILGSP